jgi:hypothetical protein
MQVRLSFRNNCLSPIPNQSFVILPKSQESIDEGKPDEEQDGELGERAAEGEFSPMYL